MELQQLKTFCTIAKTQSFTHASEMLDYAQSSISAQIRSLEEELQVKLFERMGRRIFLTAAGEKFLAYAENMLRLAIEARDVVGGEDTPKGTLIIGAPESISIYRIPEVLKEYHKCYPQVEIILKLGTCSEIYNWIRHNVIDVAILMDNQIEARDLVIEPLRMEDITLVADRNYPLAHREKTKPVDLQGEQLILIEKDGCYRCIFESQLAKAQVQPSSTLEMGSIEAIKKFVMSGLGISLLPQMTVEQELSSGVLRDLNWKDSDFNIFTLIIYHKDKWLSPAIKAFLEITRKQLKIE